MGPRIDDRGAADPGAVLERVRQIAQDVAGPAAAAIDREARWPEASLRALQAAGLGGLVVPAPDGGLGLGMLALVRACELLGSVCASSALCFGMHCVGSAVLAAKATAGQEARYLGPICRGEHLTTLALSEAGTGVHFYLPETQLHTVSGGGYRVNGEKTFVTNGGHADSYVVSVAAAGEDRPPGHFSCIVVPGSAPGLCWGGRWSGLGMRGNSSRTLQLQDVPVPAADLLGEEGDQIWYVFSVVAPYFLTAMAGTYVGIASAALEEVRRHLVSRAFAPDGSMLASRSIVQHRLGTMWAQLERTRQLAYHAAAAGDAGTTEATALLCAAKAEAAGCAVDVVNEAMTLAGGIHYRGDSPLERHLRDARAGHIMSPTTDLLRLWTGRALLDQPLLSE